MRMKTISALVPLLLASQYALADQSPFYTITEVTASSGTNFGPWAVSMSQDGTHTAAIGVENKWYAYFAMPPVGQDLAQRFRYQRGCYIYSTTTCDAYETTSNTADAWFAALASTSAQTQTYSIVDGTAQTEATGFISHYSSSTSADSNDYAGYVSGASHTRTGLLNVDGTSVSLSSVGGTSYGFVSAYDVIPATSGYLAVGTAGNQMSSSVMEKCYNGSDIDTYSPYCPGYNTQAAFWLLDSSGTVSSSTLSPLYDSDASGDDYPYVASANAVANVNGTYVAVGYSATEGRGSEPSNLATFWTIGDGSTLTSSPAATEILTEDNPGTSSDDFIDASWAVAINTNGYIIGNRKYYNSTNRNKPTQMFYALYSGGAITTRTLPITTDGVDSEAAGLNNHNLVVGWTDERGETSSPVVSSTPRLQEAFLYNINTGNRYAINDLICGKDSSGTKACEQNGYYYYIEYANAINDDGTILATARRYSSESDFDSTTNGTLALVKLNITSGLSLDSDYDVPSDYVVTNEIGEEDYDASSGGGGSVDFAALAALAALGLVGRVFRSVKAKRN